jgi:hypothetical protein
VPDKAHGRGLCFVSSEEKGLVIFLNRTICNLASNFIGAHYTPKLHDTTASSHQDNCFCNQAKANRIKLVPKMHLPSTNKPDLYCFPSGKLFPATKQRPIQSKWFKKIHLPSTTKPDLYWVEF